MSEVIERLLENFDQDALVQHYNSLSENENEKKMELDRLLKKIFKELMSENRDRERFQKFLDLLVFCVQKDLCKSPTLFITLLDMFDMSTLEQSEAIFTYLEDNIHVWKSEAFYATGKNYLLRTCNDLLKRLSRSLNTIFSGRIQLFLAHLFSIEEKSGLNLMSNFNLDNVTTHSAVICMPNDTDEEMVDFKLYKHFWTLQDFFRLPLQCYDKNVWRSFVQNADDVLACFSSFKLDSSRPSVLQQQAFFPKYLTNQKLLNLQLNDSNFRRYILLQHLIIFQYLVSTVKFKQAHHVLTEEQGSWVKTTTDKVYELLMETPPNGEDFVNVVKHVLSREENWNRWKNEGCISFRRKEEEEEVVVNKRKRRSLGEDMRSSRKVVKVGNPELTRLWNLCPDNHKASRSASRNFQKEPADFLADAILQLDPANGIEDAYKSVNDPVFSWKCMRMLSRSSASFFHANQSRDVKSVPQYLESVLSRMAKDLPSLLTSTTSLKNNGVVVKEEKEEEEEESPKPDSNPGTPGSQDTTATTTEDADGRANEEEFVDGVGEGWRRFGEVVGVMDGVLDEVEEKGLSAREACMEVLQLWKAASVEVTVEMMEDVLRLISN